MTAVQTAGLVVLVMGVAGSGKTTIGSLLAEELGYRFVDADAYHPLANVQKIARGEPLTDAEREPWLAALRQLIETTLTRADYVVLACSALKDRYREVLRVDPKRVPIVYLTGAPDLIAQRLRDRVGHFAPAALLESQLAALEPPADALSVDIEAVPNSIVSEIRTALALPVRRAP